MSTAKVYIIGAGPGSADLLTIRGIRAIRKADVLICDSLLPRTFFEGIGVPLKSKHLQWLEDDNGRKRQQQINKLMLTFARQGKTIARVKTGDPHIFGRGMEELEFLTSNGVAVEVIPGLTVATSFSALTDLALTQREKGRSLAVVTARCTGGKINEHFPKADSLVVFMCVSVLGKIVDSLISDGWPGDYPAAILERVGMPWQNQVKGNLKGIADLAQDASVRAPAILIVGKAAGDNQLSQNRPKILFTGLDPSNFRTMGTILHWPAVTVIRNEKECERLPKILGQLSSGYFGYAIFTSKTSVSIFFEALRDSDYDSRVFHSTKVIACGKGTAALLEENGITADYTPKGMGSKTILDSTEVKNRTNILLVQSATATEALASALAYKLGKVERLCLHCVQPHPELGRKLPDYDVIYFTCPSGVRAYWGKYGQKAFEKDVWCIGEVTKSQINEYGITAEVVQPYVS